MGRAKDIAGKHTGLTGGGNIKDVKIDRIGTVTIYKRGSVYYLYYREHHKTQRRRIDGNLAVARATAAKVAAALAEERPSPLGFERTTPAMCVKGFLEYIEDVKGLAWRTVDRYRAALDRFIDYCSQSEIKSIDVVDQGCVEDFVKWLRSQTRARNGMKNGKKDVYKTGGIRFILSTSRTAFNWAKRRRMLPPYSENPFSQFPIDQLRDPEADEEEIQVFTSEQEQAFFTACSEWQNMVFRPLATYGMRVGEWTYLLIENVNFAEGTIQICSKSELFWRVKTARRRQLPLTESMAAILKKLIGNRKAGFVLLNEAFFKGKKAPVKEFESDELFRRHLAKIVADLEDQNPQATKRDKRRAVTMFCRSMGQVPVKRVQNEFCKLTETIGCPDFTRTHDLRHLFATRAQETGTNPILVSQITGHRSLDMLKRYTHPSVATKREAVEKLSPARTIGSSSDSSGAPDPGAG